MQFPVLENSLTRSDASLDVASDNVSDIILPQCYTDILPCIIPVADPKTVQWNFPLPILTILCLMNSSGWHMFTCHLTVQQSVTL